jgi:hypothetical protein
MKWRRVMNKKAAKYVCIYAEECREGSSERIPAPKCRHREPHSIMDDFEGICTTETCLYQGVEAYCKEVKDE